MNFDFALMWPDSSRLGARDVASVEISAFGKLLTSLFDAQENVVRNGFRTSSVKLAFWFADNWWRLRHEPIGDPHYLPLDWRLSHEMNSGAGGSVWPALMIYGVGSRVIVAPSVGSESGFGSIRFLADRPVSVPAEDYERGVDSLLEQVVSNCAGHIDARALSASIERLFAERSDIELAAWRRLEACLGFNPDQSADGVIERLIAFEAEVGSEAIEEAAVAVPGSESPAALSKVLEASRVSDVVVDLADVRQIARNAPSPYGIAPWQAGEAAADYLRQVLSLPDVVHWRDLGDLLGTRWKHLKEATATARGLD